MDAPVPLIVCVLLAAGALVAPTARGRAWSMLGALVVTALVLGWHVRDNSALDPLTSRPAVLAAGIVAGLAVVAALALLIDRKPEALPLLAVAALPFRIPIASGGTTSNLLVPLYVVVGAGALAYVVPRIRGSKAPAEHPTGWLERVLAATIVLYGIQATYSDDFERALENVVFFYVPFALLFVLLGRVRWTRELAAKCLGVLVVLALVFAGIGFVEYATKHLLLNPKVIASNQFESYFRVNSLFFDPNIYGRFLAVVMLGIAAVVVWTRRTRDVYVGAGLLVVLWAGLVLTLSQSSFISLLVGLTVLGALRWNVKRAVQIAVAFVVVGAAFLALAPSAVHLDVGDSKSSNAATSGRSDLISGGLRLFTDKPLQGQGAGSFPRAYRRAEKVSAERATSASHTIPITVAAEQGVVGLGLYVALLVLAFVRIFRGSRSALPRAAVAAMFTAVIVHTMMYAAFLEDPLSWALLGVGVAMARGRAEVEDPPVAGVARPAAA